MILKQIVQEFSDAGSHDDMCGLSLVWSHEESAIEVKDDQEFCWGATKYRVELSISLVLASRRRRSGRSNSRTLSTIWRAAGLFDRRDERTSETSAVWSN